MTSVSYTHLWKSHTQRIVIGFSTAALGALAVQIIWQIAARTVAPHSQAELQRALDFRDHLFNGNRAVSYTHLLYHYKDGRDFPDLLETIYDFPSADGGFQLHLHCNQNNADGDERLSFFGSTGTLVVTGKSVTFTPQNVAPQFESYGYNGMTQAQRQAGMDEWLSLIHI